MTLPERLRQLSIAVSDQNWREFSMRVPAEPNRDADIVIMQAAMLLERSNAEVAELREQVALLRDALSWFQGINRYSLAFKGLQAKAKDVLAATEPKP